MPDSMDFVAAADGWLTRLGALLELGGPVVLLLMLMSVAALTIILLKLWQFHSLRLSDVRFVDPVISTLVSGNRADALARLEASRNPIARVMETAVEGRADARLSDALQREEVTRVAGRYLEPLRSHLRGLELIGTVSPLLGLLGTVLGMIEAFRQLEQAGSQVDPALLSGGIWEALLTTAVGLAVAIPAVAMLSWLERRIERFRLAMEDAVTQVFTRVPAVSAGDAGVDVLRPKQKRTADAY